MGGFMLDSQNLGWDHATHAMVAPIWLQCSLSIALKFSSDGLSSVLLSTSLISSLIALLTLALSFSALLYNLPNIL